MQIDNNSSLSEAIGKLNAKKISEEQKILQDLKSIKDYIDPVNRIHQLLPAKIPIGFSINKLIDETIMDAAGLIKNNISVNPSDSFIKIASANMLKNAVNMAVQKNSHKIKSIGLAIIKNIFN